LEDENLHLSRNPEENHCERFDNTPC
jgi:hypothetical protein